MIFLDGSMLYGFLEECIGPNQKAVKAKSMAMYIIFLFIVHELS